MCLNCFGIHSYYSKYLCLIQSKVSSVKAQFNDCSVINLKQIILMDLTCLVPRFVCSCETVYDYLKTIALLLLIQTSDSALLQLICIRIHLFHYLTL